MTNWKDEQPAAKRKPVKENEVKKKSEWNKVSKVQSCISKLKHVKDNRGRSPNVQTERHKSPPGPIQRQNSGDRSKKTLRDKGVTIHIRARKDKAFAPKETEKELPDASEETKPEVAEEVEEPVNDREQKRPKPAQLEKPRPSLAQLITVRKSI